MAPNFLYLNVRDLFEFLELDKELKDERMYDLKDYSFTILKHHLNLIQKNVYTLEK